MMDILNFFNISIIYRLYSHFSFFKNHNRISENIESKRYILTFFLSIFLENCLLKSIIKKCFDHMPELSSIPRYLYFFLQDLINNGAFTLCGHSYPQQPTNSRSQIDLSNDTVCHSALLNTRSSSCKNWRR